MTPIPDEEHGADLPLTMSASVVLTGLPRDAHQALADAEAVDTGKGKSTSSCPSTIYY
jgi:ubiquitin-like protein ATG12